MAGSTNISIRMDSDVKAQADVLFGELGMNNYCLNFHYHQLLIFLFARLCAKAVFPLRFPLTSRTEKRLLPCWKRKGLQETRP